MRVAGKFLPVAAVAAVFLGCASPAFAQTADSDLVGELDFGAWCSEVAHYSQDRCTEARPDDKTAYERYLDRTATYEKQLIQKHDAARIETDRVNRMGEVTPDTTRDRFEDNSAPELRW